MTPSASPCRSLTTLCGMAFVLACAVPAQVPPGHAIVGTFSGPNSAGTAGLFHFPIAPGPVTVTPITGLPPYLQSTGPVTHHQGVATVAYRPEDGAIVVGTVARAGGPTQGAVELFVFHLIGSAVDPSRTRQILLGTTTTLSGAWVGSLPDGRILVGASDAGGPLTSGPMANHLFAIVDVAAPTPTITPLPNPPGNGEPGSAGLDPDGRFLYYVTNSSPTPLASLHRLELATNAAAVIASWPGQWGAGVFCDDDGMVYVSASDLATATHLSHAVQPDGFNPATVTTTMDTLAVAPSGIALDRVSGRYIVQGAGFAPGFPNTNRNTVSLVDPATGAAQWVAGSPTAWGTLGFGPAVHDAMAGYGTATDGQHHHWFATFPNPGGPPALGNAAFSLTMASSSPVPPSLSALALSLGRGSLSIAGIQLLTDPGSTVLVFQPAVPYPFPIPATPGLAGLVIFVQGLHLESGGVLAATRGLQLTIH